MKTPFKIFAIFGFLMVLFFLAFVFSRPHLSASSESGFTHGSAGGGGGGGGSLTSK